MRTALPVARAVTGCSEAQGTPTGHPFEGQQKTVKVPRALPSARKGKTAMTVPGTTLCGSVQLLLSSSTPALLGGNLAVNTHQGGPERESDTRSVTQQDTVEPGCRWESCLLTPGRDAFPAGALCTPISSPEFRKGGNAIPSCLLKRRSPCPHPLLLSK